MQTADVARQITEASDYYKAVFGIRPFPTHYCPDDKEFLAAWHTASDEIERRKKTVQGRNTLRDQGWLLDGDPDCHYREKV